MFRSLLRTSWNHINRTRYVSVWVTLGFTVLFLTGIVGFSMMKLLQSERNVLSEKFTYPLFISHLYTFQSPRVQSFVESLGSTGVSGKIEYVTKEQALDQEIQRNPDILSALAGENPLPDMIMVPVYGTDITLLWSHIQEFRDIFDSVQSFDSLRSRLKKFDTSLQEIDHLVSVLLAFVGLTGVLMIMLVFVMMRYYARMFHLEYTIGRLVWAHPIVFWWPNIIAMIVFGSAGFTLAVLIFRTLGSFF